MKRKKWLWLLVPVALCVGFFYAGDFLALNEAPTHSDAIIVLGGGPEQRVAQAVRLLREGYSSRLLLSGGAIYNPWQTQAEHMKQEARALGVPSKQILLENHSETTVQNALYSLQVMKSHHLTSAIVVSSTFHMRRAWLDFLYVFSGQGIRLSFSSSPYPGFHPSTWWQTAEGRGITTSEYAKMVYTILVDFMWHKLEHL